MLDQFVEACRAARERAGVSQTHVAALLQLNQSSVARFEAGAGWPRDPDHYAAAYAAAADTGPATIWKDAVGRLIESDPGVLSPDSLSPELVAAARALAAAASPRKSPGTL